MKQLKLFCVAAGLLLGGICVCAQTNGTAGNLTWNISNDTIFIRGTGPMPDYSTSLSNINLSPWTNYTGLTTLIVGEGVTRIGNSAFYNLLSGFPSFSDLSTVRLPSTLESIGNYAFYGCRAIMDISIPDAVVSIGNNAFYGTGWYNGQPDGLVYAGKVMYFYKGTMPQFSTITIAEGTKGIGNSAFSSQKNLTAIVLPNGLKHIGTSTFSNCSNLPAVNIPSSVVSIDESAFYGCSGINSLIIPEGVRRIENKTFYGCTSLNAITLPSELESIGEEVFYNCRMLSSVVIPDRVKAIEWRAFYNCYALASVSFPQDLTRVDSYAFYYCTSLASATLPGGVTKLGDGCFSRCSKLVSVYLPNGIDTIPDNAFSQCSVLSSINLPKGVNHIGEWAFNDCKSLSAITLPDSLKTIGSQGFYGCTKLTSVVIPQGVKTIGESAFNTCSALKTVTIPQSVTNIGNGAFMRCSALKYIAVSWTNPIPVLANVFSNLTPANIKLYIPQGTADNYLSAEVWKNFNLVEISDVSVTSSDSGTTIAWQTYENAEGYRVIIYNDETHNDTVCTLKFNASGILLSIQYRSKNAVLAAAEGFTYTIEDLLSATNYYYTLEVLDGNDIAFIIQSGEFTTTDGVPTGAVETGHAPSLRVTGYYSILGQKLPKEPENGIYIILYDNGKVQKVVK